MKKSRLFTVFTMIFSILVFFSLYSFADTNNGTTIQNLADETTQIASSLVTYKASYIYGELEQGLQGIKDLEKTINDKLSGKTQISTSDMVEKAKNMFYTLYKKYKNIDDNSAQVKNGFDQLINEAKGEAILAKNKITALENQLSSLKSQLSMTNDPDEKTSLNSQIKILQQRIKIWENFSDTLSQLPLKGQKLEDGVTHFLKIVHLTVPVYYQAYMAMSEMQQIKIFLVEIKSIANLDILSAQIEQSWSDISDIVKSIEDISNGDGNNYSILTLNDIQTQKSGIFDSVTEGIPTFFNNIWNFIFPPARVYTWEDVAKLFNNLSVNLESVINRL